MRTAASIIETGSSATMIFGRNNSVRAASLALTTTAGGVTPNHVIRAQIHHAGPRP